MTAARPGRLWGVVIGTSKEALVAFPTKAEAETEAAARNARHAERVAFTGLSWNVRRVSPSEVRP